MISEAVAPTRGLMRGLIQKFYPPTPPGRPGVDRPVLVRDLSFARKWLWVRPILYLTAGLGGYLAVRGFVGLYFDATQLNEAENAAYHAIFHVDWIRHLIVRDATEKLFAFAAIQIIVYNFATKWPRKEPNKLDRIEHTLRIPNARAGEQGFIVLLLSPIWLIIYGLPGEFAFAGILKLFGLHQDHPASWQITLVGLAGSWVFGRRIAKGIAYQWQWWMIKERLETQSAIGHEFSPGWWWSWTIKSRFRWEAAHWDRSRMNRIWKHRRLQILVKRIPLILLVCVAVFLIAQGFWVLHDYANAFAPTA